MRLPTRRTTRSPLVRLPPCNDGLYRSLKTGGQACPPPECSTKEHHLNGGHRTSVREKRTPGQTISVIATNLTSGAVTVCARYKAEALAEVQQRMDPKLRQECYEIQLEFLETVELTQSVAARPGGDGFPATKAAVVRNGDGAGVGRDWEHKNEGDRQ
jgi:hypothetical protein